MLGTPTAVSTYVDTTDSAATRRSLAECLTSTVASSPLSLLVSQFTGPLILRFSPADAPTDDWAIPDRPRVAVGTADYPCDRRGISDAAELHALHAATYEMAPGEDLSRTYHSTRRARNCLRARRRAHLETPDGEYVVSADEVCRRTGQPAPRDDPADADESSRG